MYPQDGFNGKTISFLFKNFSAVVTIEQAEGVELVPNPEHDQCNFGSLMDLHDHTAVKVYVYYCDITTGLTSLCSTPRDTMADCGCCWPHARSSATTACSTACRTAYSRASG